MPLSVLQFRVNLFVVYQMIHIMAKSIAENTVGLLLVIKHFFRRHNYHILRICSSRKSSGYLQKIAYLNTLKRL